jgi:hypothetical protein
MAPLLSGVRDEVAFDIGQDIEQLEVIQAIQASIDPAAHFVRS